MTERVKTAAPRSETGYAISDSPVEGWMQWDPFESVSDLQWPASVKVFSQMANGDSRAASVLEAIALPVLRTAWHIDPNGARDEVVEFVSRNVNLPILGVDAVENPGRLKDRFSWSQHLMWALDTLQFGHAVFEQIYRADDAGRYWIRKLAPRPQRTISAWNVALDGGLKSIEQYAPASTGKVVFGIKPVEIPVNRLVVYTRKREPGRWIGKSILRPAYKHWLLKDELMRIEAAAARRNGMGVPVGTASSSNDQAEVDHMQQLASEFRGGMHAGVGLAAGQSMELLAPNGNLLDPRPAIDWHDRQIALAGLAHFLNLDKGGSYALASVQADTFVQSVQTYAESVRDTANAHIVEDLIDINFGVDEAAPRIVFDEIGSRQDATAAALKMLVEAGLLSPDVLVERTVRRQLGLPAKPDTEEPTDDGGDEPPPTTTARSRRGSMARGEQPALF